MLVASACGASVETGTSADSSSSTPDSDSSSSTAETSEEPADDDASADDASTDEASTDEASTEETAGENLFPDIDVVNIVDGSTVNLAAELGGGDLPVLLWFWAPH